MSAHSICAMYEPILGGDNGQWSANNHPVKKKKTRPKCDGIAAFNYRANKQICDFIQ